MQDFEAAFAASVVRNSWAIIILSVLAMLYAMAGVRLLQFDASYRVYFGPDNPQRVAFETLEATYVKNDAIVIAVAPGNGRVFTRESLAIIEELTRRAWQTPFSNRVDSLTNF